MIQFLKTEYGIDGMEYAWLFDDVRDVVFKKRVMSETTAVQISNNIPMVATSLIPPIVTQEYVPPAPSKEPSYAPLNQPLPKGDMPRQPSMIPPHLRGVFVERDQPGAAVETRQA